MIPEGNDPLFIVFIYQPICLIGSITITLKMNI